jgi:hypothetical protein
VGQGKEKNCKQNQEKETHPHPGSLEGALQERFIWMLIIAHTEILPIFGSRLQI